MIANGLTFNPIDNKLNIFRFKPLFYTCIIGVGAIALGNGITNILFKTDMEKAKVNYIFQIFSEYEINCIIHLVSYDFFHVSNSSNFERNVTFKESMDPANWLRKLERKDISQKVIKSRD
jgi:hypothetical protein